MAFSANQKASLDLWASRQFELNPGGQSGDRQGFLTGADGPVNLGSAIDSLQTRTIMVPFTLPAPAGGAVDVDIPAFKCEAAGKLVSVEIVPMTAWGAGNNVGDKYLTAVRQFSGTPGNVSFAHDLVAGVGAAAGALLPTGASAALLTSGDDLTITATGASIVMLQETAWVTTPVVGDYVTITSAATGFVGAGVVNPGVYRIASVGTLTLTATKVYGANPVSVALAASAAGDVAGIRLVSQTEASFAASDLLGLRVTVPINTTTPVDVSTLKFLAVFRYRTTV